MMLNCPFMIVKCKKKNLYLFFIILVCVYVNEKLVFQYEVCYFRSHHMHVPSIPKPIAVLEGFWDPGLDAQPLGHWPSTVPQSHPAMEILTSNCIPSRNLFCSISHIGLIHSPHSIFFSLFIYHMKPYILSKIEAILCTLISSCDNLHSSHSMLPCHRPIYRCANLLTFVFP